MLRTASPFTLATLAVLAGAPATASPVFMGLGDLPGGSFRSVATDVSADGRVVVGWGTSSDGARAFRWTLETGMQDLGPGDAGGVSLDGSFVVGGGPDGAFRWSTGSGMQLLGGGSSFASSVSADGSIVVGSGASGRIGQIQVGEDEYVDIPVQGEAFRWTSATGVQYLGVNSVEPQYYEFGSHASAVSPDGTVIVGGGTVDIGERYGTAGFIWNGTVGPTPILLEPEWGSWEAFTGISPDGSILTGGSGWEGEGPGRFWATRLADGSVILGGRVPGDDVGHLWDASLYGEVMVGSIEIVEGGPEYPRAYVLLDSGTDLRFLDEFIANDLGIDITGWELQYALAVSSDGRTIAGYGINPNGQREGWLLIVPEPSVAACLMLGFSMLGAHAPPRAAARCATSRGFTSSGACSFAQWPIPSSVSKR